MASARSSVNVGLPRWSSTKASSGRSRSPRTVFTMFRPWTPHTHAVRTMVEAGSTSSSPPRFDRPYAEAGAVGSHSTYGVGLVPSKT